MTILALEMRASEKRGPIKLGRKRDASRNFRPFRQALATSRYPFVAFSPMSLLTCLVAASASAQRLGLRLPRRPQPAERDGHVGAAGADLPEFGRIAFDELESTFHGLFPGDVVCFDG